MPLNIIVGAQWGDEGKGRVVDLLAAKADFVARFNGGDNAGHTVTVGDKTFKLHLVPSGIIHPRPVAVIGNGVVVNPAILLEEMQTLIEAGIEVHPKRFCISYAAHLITSAHLALDQAQEAARGRSKIGTTQRGIGPTYIDKVARRGLRMEGMLTPKRFLSALENLVKDINHQLTRLYDAEPVDVQTIIDEAAEHTHRLSPYIGDVSSLLTEALKSGQQVLAEGAQGTLLDLDHGTYPFVTSSTPTAPGALVGLGLGIGYEERVIAVTKAFQTRVGEGSFPTELSGELAARLRGSGENPWDEFGTTTGRPRRVGWLDMVLLRYAARVNGLTELALTKLDILSGLDTIYICDAYRHKEDPDAEKGVIQNLPCGPGDLDSYEPIYEKLPGWEEDLRMARRWEDLPENTRAYILRIEELSGVPVRLVSVGAERSQVVEIG
jgi:adenylosuccinate synthase